VSVNSEVPSTHLAFQLALLGKQVNTLPPDSLQERRDQTTLRLIFLEVLAWLVQRHEL